VKPKKPNLRLILWIIGGLFFSCSNLQIKATPAYLIAYEYASLKPKYVPYAISYCDLILSEDDEEILLDAARRGLVHLLSIIKSSGGRLQLQLMIDNLEVKLQTVQLNDLQVTQRMEINLDEFKQAVRSFREGLIDATSQERL